MFAFDKNNIACRSTICILLLSIILTNEITQSFSPSKTTTTIGCKSENNGDAPFSSIILNVSPPPTTRTTSTTSYTTTTDSFSISFSKRKKLKDITSKITRLGRAGKTNEALSTYYSVDEPTVRLMNGAIDACARARPTRLREAFQIVDQSNLRPNVFTFGSLISACARAKDADRALSVLRSMKIKYGISPNAVVYSTVISAVARSDPPRPQLAIDLLKEATVDKKLIMNVVGYNSVIAACAKGGDWKRAISVLKKMEERMVDIDDYDNNCEETGTAATTTTNSYKSFAQPDSVTYGTILSACEKGEQWQLLLRIANIATNKRNIRLDVLAMTSCLHACQQLGLANEAVRYLDLMKKESEVESIQIPSRSMNDTTATPMASKRNTSPMQNRKTFGWQRMGSKKPLRGPDEVSYRLAISACARGGEWSNGIRLLDEYREVTGHQPDVVAYTAAITGCEYAGEWQVAFRLLERMRKDGIEPNECTMAAIIGACATACNKIATSKEDNNSRPFGSPPSKNLLPEKAALRLFNILKKDDTVVNPNIRVYNAAIRTFAEACDMEQAMKLFNEIRSSKDTNSDGKGVMLEPTVVTYGTMMTACERTGNVDALSKIFRLMKEDDIEPNEIIYGAAISCCRKANQPERTLLLLRKMIREGLSPNVATLNTVIRSQSEGSRSKKGITDCMKRSVTLYKLMTPSKTTISKEVESSEQEQYAIALPRPNRETYNILIRQFAFNTKPKEAEYFLQKMRDDGYTPDVDLYTATVTGYEKNRQPLKAIRLMESMREDGYDFYEIDVLNNAFKKAIKLVNVLGQTLHEKKNGVQEQVVDDLKMI